MHPQSPMIQNITLPNVLEYQPQSYEVLPMENFIIMDNAAIEYGLDIPIMMEHAGYQLAKLVYQMADRPKRVVVGVGPGNNGGGGLVAARRLQGWGIETSLHLISDNANSISQEQLARCIKFGVSTSPDWNADVFIDAYLGFSQRLPLDEKFERAVKHTNRLDSLKISLDIPTGIGDSNLMVLPDAVLTLAAPKTTLIDIRNLSPVFIADIGIPFSIYRMFGFTSPLPFGHDGIIQWV